MPDDGTAADRLREALRNVLAATDDGAVSRLRGELHVVEAMAQGDRLGDGPSGKVRAALKSVADLQTLTSEVRAFSASKRHSEVASLFDLASVGILGVENVLTAEHPSLSRLLMSGLSEASMYAASRQYVAGSSQVLAGLYRSQRVALEDDLWSLALEVRGPTISEAESLEVRDGIDAFFATLEAPEVAVEAKVSALYQTRFLLVILRCLTLLDALERSPHRALA